MAKVDRNHLSERDANLLASFTAIHSQDPEQEIINALEEIVADSASVVIGQFCRSSGSSPIGRRRPFL